jgi:hypothetical protein
MGHAILERVLLFGTRSADNIRARSLGHRAETLVSGDCNRQDEPQSCGDNKQTLHAALYMDAGIWTGLAAAAGLEKSVVTLSNEARFGYAGQDRCSGDCRRRA